MVICKWGRKVKVHGLKGYPSIIYKTVNQGGLEGSQGYPSIIYKTVNQGGVEGSQVILTRQAKGPQLHVGKLDISKTRHLVHSIYQDNIRVLSL